jgi:hypothetical protein
MLETRAELHMGICRQCFGTGMARDVVGRTLCRACNGDGASV